MRMLNQDPPISFDKLGDIFAGGNLNIKRDVSPSLLSDMIDPETKELVGKIIFFGEVTSACAIAQTLLLLLLFVLTAFNGEKEKPQTSKEETQESQKETNDAWISWGSNDQAMQGCRQPEDCSKAKASQEATTLRSDGYDWPWGLEPPKNLGKSWMDGENRCEKDFFTTPKSPRFNVPTSFQCTCRMCSK